MRIGCVMLVFAFGVPAWAAPAPLDLSRLPAAAERPIDFVKDVQPILSASCYQCHGPKRAEAGLRFDRKSDALRGSENGQVILPGKGAESLIVHAVSGLKDDLKMPKKGERLTAEQVGVLRAWIDQGAVWPDSASGERNTKNHWAFKAPERPPVPVVKAKNWVRTPVDNFVLSRLEKEKLAPSPEADKTTLLRRLSLDLVGLPPTIGEVDAFLADKDAKAYETQVERLLDSPHYGERWGRHWLDAARYADSDGFEKDKPRYIWFYRDYVIDAFNRDLPYNQFIIEQLAGDLLPNPTQDQIVATGFLRNSMINEEGGVDPEQFRMDAMFDRMDAIGKSMLGLTIQCGQCHNHKYDPLTQEEYYRLFAFINNDHEASVVGYNAEEQRLIANLTRQMREIEATLQHRAPDWQDRMAQWEESVRNDQPEWIVCQVEHIGENDQRYYYLKDGSMLAAGYAPTKMTTVWKTTNKLDRVGAFRLELFTDSNLPANGPGRAFKGTCALTEFKVDAADAGDSKTKTSVKIVKATADYGNPKRDLEPNFYDKSTNNRVTGPIEYAIDGDSNTAWGIDQGPGRRNQDRKAVFVPDKSVSFSNGTVLTFRLTQNHGGWNSDDLMNNNLGRFRLSVTSATNVTADPLPRKVRDIITNVPCEKRTPAQVAAVFAYWRTTVPDWKDANEKIENLWAQWPTGATTLTLAARTESRMTAILRRGDWLKPSKPVNTGTPAFLHPLPPSADESRLTFAKWITDRKSPTTARVFVNRMWQAYFGTGIVGTPEDFGMQAEAPSHPELLDWLACEFMDCGWSMKHMHRLIVNSATYRQSSKVTPELYERDPYNRLLARGSRLRVEGEIVRDITLAASGLLNEKVGGKSIMPPAPAFIFQPPASYAPFPWIDETGPDKYRRAIYTWRRRSTPYPALQAFDVPNADFSCVRRSRSNTPLQALTALNETLFMESAQALAKRAVEKGGKTDPERITYAFRLCAARKPTADEQKELLAFLEKQRTRFGEGWIEPKKLFGEDIPTGSNPTQLAAWTALARVLLNLDETITKE